MLSPVLVTQGSKLATKEEVIFEAETSVLLVPARLEKIISSFGKERKDNLDAQQQKGLSFYAFGEEAEVGSSLYLGFNPLDLFEWDKVPGFEENADTERLKQYLDQYLGISWIKDLNNEAICKINEGKTITIADGDRELSLELDEANNRVKLSSTPDIRDEIYFYILEKDNKYIYAQPFPANRVIPLTFNLFEKYRVARGSHGEESVEFVPSVSLRWEYYSTAGYWKKLQVNRDETQMLYQSGRQIENFLTQQFLNPLTGGREGKGWAFGRTVYRSEVYRAIENSMEGVDCVENLELLVGDSDREEIAIDPGSGNIPISLDSLIYSTRHQIEIVSGRI